jgi:hypothetical protein
VIIAVENLRLKEQMTRMEDGSHAKEVELLQADIAQLRSEILRLTEENKRLQSTPKA